MYTENLRTNSPQKEMHAAEELDETPGNQVSHCKETGYESDNSYEMFIQRLKCNYPSLTSNDIEFCLMLKKGMDTADIARLSNLSKSTIRSKKMRIKEKMKIEDSKIKIDKFMSDF